MTILSERVPLNYSARLDFNLCVRKSILTENWLPLSNSMTSDVFLKTFMWENNSVLHSFHYTGKWHNTLKETLASNRSWRLFGFKHQKVIRQTFLHWSREPKLSGHYWYCIICKNKVDYAMALLLRYFGTSALCKMYQHFHIAWQKCSAICM